MMGLHVSWAEPFLTGRPCTCRKASSLCRTVERTCLSVDSFAPFVGVPWVLIAAFSARGASASDACATVQPPRRCSAPAVGKRSRPSLIHFTVLLALFRAPSRKSTESTSNTPISRFLSHLPSAACKSPCAVHSALRIIQSHLNISYALIRLSQGSRWRVYRICDGKKILYRNLYIRAELVPMATLFISRLFATMIMPAVSSAVNLVDRPETQQAILLENGLLSYLCSEVFKLSLPDDSLR